MTFPTATTVAGKHRQVYEGKADKMPSGLTKKDLKVSKTGKIVSKAKSRLAKQNSEPLKMWRQALAQACDERGVSYTIPKKRTALYNRAKAIYDDM